MEQTDVQNPWNPIGYFDLNGDIVYTNPLPALVVYPDFAVQENATYEDFHEAYLNNLRNQAADKFKYSLAGVAPLHYFTEDGPNSVTNNPEEPFFYSLEAARSEIQDSIKSRTQNGFYKLHPHQRDYDEMILKQYDYPCYGWSCIFSNTNPYGERFGNMSNPNFSLRPFGFKEVNVNSDLGRGDIVQLRRPWLSGYEGIRPFHAVMHDSYTPDRDSINVYDNHGHITPERVEESNFVLDSFNQHPNQKDHVSAFKGFKFFGDDITEQEISEAYQKLLKCNHSN